MATTYLPCMAELLLVPTNVEVAIDFPTHIGRPRYLSVSLSDGVFESLLIVTIYK